MRLEGEVWQAYFRDFKHSIFRFETQPTYSMPAEQETVAMYLAGKPKPEGFNSTWHAKLAAKRAEGKSMIRAKVVRRPFTDYTRYLFDWAIPGNVDAGEDYRILDLTGSGNPGLPEQDFWLFDDQTVVDMLYRPDGTQIGRELVEEPDLDTYRGWRDLALSLAVPFAEYMRT